MLQRYLIALAISSLALPATALAEDAGFFAGLDATGGIAFGSSSTTDGGAPFAGGGIVDNVKFRGTVGLGGVVGYHFASPLSAFLSYRQVQGGIGWDADFPLFGVSSGFDGTAISRAVMGNLAYDFALSDVTTLRAAAGVGLSFNTLSDVVEKDNPTGAFLSNVEDHTRTSPTAQLDLGIQHALTPAAIVGLSASIIYSGGFETGDTRSGNLGVTAINPYAIDDVWRANLGASIRVRF